MTGRLEDRTLEDRTLGDLVAEAPVRGAVFDRLALDYCCHGQRSLADACREAQIDVAEVVAALDALPAPGADAALPEGDAAALADGIVARHHTYLREELPALVELAGKVAGVHGPRHPELATVQELVDALAGDLLPHLDEEERVVFPAVHRLAAGETPFPFGAVRNPIAGLVREHEAAGALLARLREATGGYATPDDGCASYRALYDRLGQLESDTHLHIHTEQNVLFPLVLALEAGD